ncbi:MAG: hypothetical protein JNM18_14840, partial [Planctomycetaceae bacterium]|nr:hypothetical protein [Planctomycetaceae bacterium]
MRYFGSLLWITAVVVSLSSFAATLWAVDGPAKAGDPAKTKEVALSKDELALKQQQIAEKYRRFEEVILRMAELTAATDPKRAALLRRAAAQSKDQLIGLQLEKLAETIRKGTLGSAVKNQADVEQELSTILELLMTEQRQDRVKEERERLKEQLRKIKEFINRQTELKGQTENAADVKELSPRQGRLAEDTAKLAQDMKAAGAPKQSDAKSKGAEKSAGDGDSKKDGSGGEEKQSAEKSKDSKGDSKSGDKNDKDAKSGDKDKDSKQSDQDKSKSGDSKSGEKSDGKSQEKGDSKSGKSSKSDSKSKGQGDPKQGDPMEGEGSQSQDQQQQQQSPGQKRIAAAQQKMQDAKKKLDEAKKDGAQQDQEEAIRELEQAKAELEDILRQLREEELARTLAQLEQRFREMLVMQHEVYEGTKRLDAVPADRRSPNDEVESGRLSRRESQILVEAEKALTVLRDEGSAVAFPEAVEMMRDDMQIVVQYLARFKVDKVTQGVEEDIIAALEEMIAALQKAQKKQEEQKQKPQPGQGGEQEQPLVDQLAELKMIRALQMRVNTRTKRYQKLVDGPDGTTDQPELVKALKE